MIGVDEHLLTRNKFLNFIKDKKKDKLFEMHYPVPSFPPESHLGKSLHIQKKPTNHSKEGKKKRKIDKIVNTTQTEVMFGDAFSNLPTSEDDKHLDYYHENSLNTAQIVLCVICSV